VPFVTDKDKSTPTLTTGYFGFAKNKETGNTKTRQKENPCQAKKREAKIIKIKNIV